MPTLLLTGLAPLRLPRSSPHAWAPGHTWICNVAGNAIQDGSIAACASASVLTRIACTGVETSMVHKVGAHGDIVLDLGLDRKELEKEAKESCKRLLTGWRALDAESIEVSEISGGITNILWKLSPSKTDRLEPVVLRVFGKQTDKIIDREKEKVVLKHLNKAGFGAQVLATFENGRIEAYMPMRPLKPEEMVARPMASRIAHRLKQMHAVDMGMPLEPALFSTIRKWLKQARKLDFSDDSRKAKAHRDINFDSFEKEVARVEAAAEELQPEPCFAHNDLLSGNILVPESEAEGSPESQGEVQFIDFEYTEASYCSFDIANHFNEYAGFECDYSRFPDDAHVTHFVSEYLQQGANDHPGAGAVAGMVAQCYVMALASHQFWGTWAILQAKYSPIDFDYIGYLKLRWDEYFRRRDEFLCRAEQPAAH